MERIDRKYVVLLPLSFDFDQSAAIREIDSSEPLRSFDQTGTMETVKGDFICHLHYAGLSIIALRGAESTSEVFPVQLAETLFGTLLFAIRY